MTMTMNPIDETIQKRKQENYEKAWKDLMQALDSFRKLDNEQKICSCMI